VRRSDPTPLSHQVLPVETYVSVTYIVGEETVRATPARRPDRINLRLSRASKRKLERAAAYSDKTLTDFVIDVALQKAESIVRKQEVITLTGDEWARFQDLLLHPPLPNRRLKRSLSDHARVVRQ